MADKDTIDDPARQADTDLARVQAKVEAARALLARLLQDVVVAETRLGQSEAARLLEVNEQLVLTALRDRAEAEQANQSLAKVSRSAELDPLTRLPNRILLLDRFAQAIATAKRYGRRLAVLFLDLDNFKQINDTLGHAAGDEVLKLMAHRLVAGVRDADTVSRHGGDEFVILLTEIAQPVDARRIADQLRTALAAPSRIGDTVLRLTASVGISIYPDDGDDVQTLVQCADAAMYQAKRQRLGSLNFHDAQATAPGLTDGAAAAPVAAALNDPISRHGAAVEIQRQRYAELREANEQLVLAALSARDMQAAAERAHRDQTEFMDLLARELANPLAPIRLAAAMLGQVQSAEPLLPRAQSIIERQVRSMTHLVTAVQDVASAGRSTFGLVRKIVDMASVVDAAVGACRPAMDVRLQTFTVQWPDPPAQAQVLGEAGRLEQVARNLLDNASQYTPDLGWIRLVLAVQGDEVELTVSDSGIGITAIALPTIFEPFAQDIAAIGIRDVGPGVGLAVVRALVQAHGGTVLASSAGTGRGSRFTVTLPLARTSASAPEVARSVTPHDNGPDSPGPGATE